MKTAPVLAALLVAAALPAVPTGDAYHCASHTVVFSHIRNVPASAEPSGVGCLAAPAAEADLRYIWPAAEWISLRYTADAGADHLLATLDGLGLDNQVVRLDRTTDVTGSLVLYTSGVHAIDPAARGELAVVVTTPEGALVDETVYRTVA